MEILNNIWLAFSTENEMLVNIILIPAFFIESLLTFSLLKQLFNITCSNKEKNIYIFSLSIEGIISSLFIPSPFNIFINYIFAFVIIYKLFKLNILKTILAIVIPMIIFIISTTLLLDPYITILNIDYTKAQLIPIYRIIFLILEYLLVFIILTLMKLAKIKLSLFEDLPKKSKIIIFINFILGILTLLVQVILVDYYIDIIPVYMNFLNVLSLLTYFFISFYSLTRVTKLSQTTKSLESAEEYNKSLTILHDTVKGFKHDFDNIINTLGGYITTNDMEGLKKYYSWLDTDSQKAKNLSTLNPRLINNPGIYSLLSSKYHKADEKNIKINLEYFVNLDDFKIKTYEFSRILGILLDNAIEASSECDEKIINIIFRNEEKNHRHIVIVENTYSNKDVDTEEIFKKGVSGKENHTGLGLWEIRQYIKKSNNLNLFTSKTNNFFKQQLEIYY